MAIAAVVVGLAVLVVGTASAWTPTREGLKDRRAHVNELRSEKCLQRYDVNYLPRDLSPYWLKRKWNTWGVRKQHTKARSSKCVPTNPREIIRYVFPAASEDLAIRVASCETVGFTDYYNESSRASGLFQLMPLHWEGKFDPFNMLANARYALQLSYNGTNFYHAWYASVGCWG